MASDGVCDVFRRPRRRRVTGHEFSPALTSSGIPGELSSCSIRSMANSSAAANPGCFCLSNLRTYSMFCVLCPVITFAMVIFLTHCQFFSGDLRIEQHPFGVVLHT